MRKLARSIVAARAARSADEAGAKVKAPGKFRRWLFRENWSKTKWRANPSWGSPTHEKTRTAALMEKLGVRS